RVLFRSVLLDEPLALGLDVRLLQYPLELEDTAEGRRRPDRLRQPLVGRVNRRQRRVDGLVRAAQKVVVVKVPAKVDDVTVGQHDRAALHKDRKSTRLNSSHVKISYA